MVGTVTDVLKPPIGLGRPTGIDTVVSPASAFSRGARLTVPLVRPTGFCRPIGPSEIPDLDLSGPRGGLKPRGHIASLLEMGRGAHTTVGIVKTAVLGPVMGRPCGFFAIAGTRHTAFMGRPCASSAPVLETLPPATLPSVCGPEHGL